MERKINPWIVCAASTLLLFCNVGLTASAFPVFQPYLISVLGLTNSQSSMFLTVRTLAGLAATFIVQRYLKKFGPGKGVFYAGLIIAAAFAILGVSHGFAGACVSAVLLGSGSALGGMVAVSVIINRVFTRNMGLALSICAVGTSMATVICTPIATWAIEAISLQFTLLVAAVFVALCVLLVYMVLRRVPDSESTAAARSSGSSLSELLKDPGLRLCLIAMFFLGIVANVGYSHLSVLYRTAGMSSEQVAFLMSTVGAFLIVGKLLFGASVDRLGAKFTFTVACITLVLGTALACCADRCSMAIGVGSMLFYGFSMPMGTLSPGLFARFFAKPEHFDYAVGRLQLSYMIGALVFGPVPGMMADASGSYVSSFMVMTGFCVIITVLTMIAFSLKKK